MPKYKGIEFPNDYKISFGQFKKDFSDSHVFLNTPAENLESELEKAYNILTNNGQLQSTAKKSKESDTNEVK